MPELGGGQVSEDVVMVVDGGGGDVDLGRPVRLVSLGFRCVWSVSPVGCACLGLASISRSSLEARCVSVTRNLRFIFAHSDS